MVCEETTYVVLKELDSHDIVMEMYVIYFKGAYEVIYD